MCNRLYRAGEGQPDAGAGHDPPAQIRGAAATAQPHRPESAGADDRDATAPSSGKRRGGGENRPALAQDQVSVGQGPAPADLCAAEHAHVVQQHLSAGPGNRSWRQADELAALFEDLFAEPDAKAVVFSQWTRTHDIVIRRLEARGLGYASFHGGVPSEKRPALVERFRDDPACRVFLSTDAGSTSMLRPW